MLHEFKIEKKLLSAFIYWSIYTYTEWCLCITVVSRVMFYVLYFIIVKCIIVTTLVVQ